MGFMDFFGNIRRKEKMEEAVREYFKVINGYTPSFTSFEGGLYEMELTRAAIHSFATHCSKLKAEISGTAHKNLERVLQFRPNYLMDAKKYLYRIATEYATDNNAFIVPLYNNRMEIIGFYPLHSKKCQMLKYEGTLYLRYEFASGIKGAIELENVGRMIQFQYGNELFGESNSPLRPTMEMINANNQGIVEGVKSAANIRFMAKLSQTLKPSDLEKERENFRATQLSASNSNGVLLFDQKYDEVKQITSEPFTVNAGQMMQIKANVYDYFGTNEKIMHSEFTSDEWNAYYEAKIEPFALEASLVHTSMIFSDREVALGNQVIFTSNRLNYMSNTEKLETVIQLFDRGFLTHNEGREMMNLDPVDGGDKFYIRKEYAEKDNLDAEVLAKIGDNKEDEDNADDEE